MLAGMVVVDLASKLCAERDHDLSFARAKGVEGCAPVFATGKESITD